MLVCVGELRSSSNYRAVTEAVEAVLKETRHDSLLKKVKQCLSQCGEWPANFAEKFPVVAEVKGLDQVDEMRSKLVEGLKVVLRLQSKAEVSIEVEDVVV